VLLNHAPAPPDLTDSNPGTPPIRSQKMNWFVVSFRVQRQKALEPAVSALGIRRK